MGDQPTTSGRTSRVQRFPRNQQRERVLRLVRDHPGAIDAVELADRMGLHVTTARFHLDALCDEGEIARTRIKRAGVGRPRTGYVPVRDRLDYRSLAEVLALELGDTPAERRRRAERAGQRWADRIMAPESPAEPADGGNDPTAETDVAGRAAWIARIFDRMGFDTELTPATETVDGRSERTIKLHGCPVRDLAQTHPEVSCAMHLGLLRGLLGPERDGVGRLRAELDPFAEPQMCIARVISGD